MLITKTTKEAERIMTDNSHQRERMLAEVRRDGRALRDADDAFKADREILLTAMQTWEYAFRYADATLKADRDILLAAILQDAHAFKFADAALRADPDVIRAAVRLSEYTWQYVDDVFKADPDVVKIAIQRNAHAFVTADDSLRTDREFVLAAVQKNWAVLGYADDSFRKDRDIALAAVRLSKEAWYDIDDCLKADRDFMLTAIQQNGANIQYADEVLKADRELALTAVRQSADAWRYIDLNIRSEIEASLKLDKDNPLKADRRLILSAVQQDGDNLQYADEALKADRDVVLAAVQQRGLSLKHAADSFKADPDIVLAAVKQNCHALEFASDALRADRNLVLMALQQSGHALQYAHDALKADRDIVRAAASTSAYALRYAHDSLKTEVKIAPLSALVADNTAFAIDLYQQLNRSDGNLFFSPYSISILLAMTYAGARGNTEQEMARTLRFSLCQEELHPAFAAMEARLSEVQAAGHVTLNAANSLWPHRDYPLVDEYLGVIERHYGISIKPLDYRHAKEAARETINRWVQEKTQDKIVDLISPDMIDAETRLVLVNATYFKGDWENQFLASKTKDAPFYLSLESAIPVPMMTQTESFNYAEHDALQILELAYRGSAGSALSMLVLLPREYDGLAKLEKGLTFENLELWINSLQRKEVRVFLPKFKMELMFGLEETLAAMGMVDAFSKSNANFAGMHRQSNGLYIGAVAHKAFVDVNEEGTEAAAATVAYGFFCGPSQQTPVFRADHPFIYLIRDQRTGCILFLGRMTEPGTSTREHTRRTY